MKKMKVFLALLLTCGMLVGCSNKNKTEEEIKALMVDAQNKMAEVDSAKMILTGDIQMAGDLLASTGMNDADIDLDFTMQFKNMKSKNIELVGQFKLGVMGINLDGEMYMKDEALYVNILGQKMKLPVDLSAMDLVETTIAPTDLSMFTNWSYESKDGLDYIGCEFSPKFYEGMLEETKQEDTGLTRSHMTCRYGIDKEGFISKIEMGVDMEITTQGETISYMGTIFIDVTDQNKVGDLTFPDFSDYLTQDLDVGDF